MLSLINADYCNNCNKYNNNTTITNNKTGWYYQLICRIVVVSHHQGAAPILVLRPWMSLAFYLMPIIVKLRRPTCVLRAWIAWIVLNPFNNALGPKPTKPTKERDMKPFVALPKISKLGSKEKNALEEKNNTNLSMYLSVCKLCTNLYIHEHTSTTQ